MYVLVRIEITKILTTQVRMRTNTQITIKKIKMIMKEVKMAMKMVKNLQRE
jgi:hypothetical protein